MTKSNQIKAALVALLGAAAVVGQWTGGRGAFGGPWRTAGVLLFGLFNVLFDAPGTAMVRGCAVLIAALVLMSQPATLGVLLLILTWLLWPPALMVSWAIGRAGGDPEQTAARGRQARIAVAVIIAAVAIASLVFRLLVFNRLEQTSALFIGIPALLAIVVVFGVSPSSAIGVACKAVTVGLLVSLLFLGEGIACVAMSAPLFYAVAIAIASSMERLRRPNEGSGSLLFSCAFLLALVPMTLEGVTGLTTLSRDETVTASNIVYAPAADVERALFAAPRFHRPRPRYLRAGLPSPLSMRIERRSGEELWIVQVRGGEMKVDGMEPRTGDLVLALEEARPGLVRWRAVSDSSHTTHFLDWRESIVQWEPIDAQTTRVSWTLTYRRGLDPAWYFAPMERYAAGLAAGYLIDVVATP